MVASFSENKDYPTFFKAAQILLKKRNDITFLAIGNRTDSEDSRSLIADQFFGQFQTAGQKVKS